MKGSVQKREDVGNDACEHLMLGLERQAPVVPSSRHARLVPNLKGRDGDSLLGQNLGKLQRSAGAARAGQQVCSVVVVTLRDVERGCKRLKEVVSDLQLSRRCSQGHVVRACCHLNSVTVMRGNTGA